MEFSSYSLPFISWRCHPRSASTLDEEQHYQNHENNGFYQGHADLMDRGIKEVVGVERQEDSAASSSLRKLNVTIQGFVVSRNEKL